MKEAYLNICRLLASSGYNERAIAEFIDELFRQGPNVVLDEIGNIRRLIKSMSTKDISDVPTDGFISLSNETALKVERLLIHDAGMSKKEAAKILKNELQFRYPNKRIPSISKKGFYTWVRSIINVFPEKEILHVATNIRNRSVKDSPNDWRLK